tara:strand:- start:1593 stop:1739 length:147 start_codon:yes stop_codon:yes gene_type:complete
MFFNITMHIANVNNVDIGIKFFKLLFICFFPFLIAGRLKRPACYKLLV